MQNNADGMCSPIDPKNLPSIPQEQLSTFLLLQDRSKLLSTTKKAFVAGQPLAETPFGALYDWHHAMRSLLSDSCHITLPQEATQEEFVQEGPSFIFSFHPAMGPLWAVIGQKLSGGTIAKGSELELEIAEISCHGLNLAGSLRILATTPTKSVDGKGSTQYSDKVGRANLHNVTVTNKGLARRSVVDILNGIEERSESCQIDLEGFSEIEAENITIKGPFRLVVPDGKRAVLHQESSGTITTTLESISSPSWRYSVEWKSGAAPVLSQISQAQSS
jgi:hypothetical protein